MLCTGFLLLKGQKYSCITTENLRNVEAYASTSPRQNLKLVIILLNSICSFRIWNKQINMTTETQNCKYIHWSLNLHRSCSKYQFIRMSQEGTGFLWFSEVESDYVLSFQVLHIHILQFCLQFKRVFIMFMWLSWETICYKVRADECFSSINHVNQLHEQQYFFILFNFSSSVYWSSQSRDVFLSWSQQPPVPGNHTDIAPGQMWYLAEGEHHRILFWRWGDVAEALGQAKQTPGSLRSGEKDRWLEIKKSKTNNSMN